MILMILNIILVVSSILSILNTNSVPSVLAIPCGIIGGITVYSRYLAWKTGAAQYGYYLVKNSEITTRKMRNRELLFLLIGIFNIFIFLCYI